MADQAQANLSLNVASSLFSDNKLWNFTDTLAGQFQAAGIQTITTAYGAVTIGDMASTDVGLAVFHNLDSANYIEYGSTNGEWRLNPKQVAFARINPGATIQAKANSAAVKIAKYIIGK